MMNSKIIRKPISRLVALMLAAVAGGCWLDGCGGGDGSAAPVGASAGPVGAACTGGSCVNLGTAVQYAILAKTGASTVPNSAVTGNVGLSPAARTFLTGWSLITDPTDTYFTSTQVAAPGKLYAADNVGGTTSVDLTTAVRDMQTAYTAAAGKAGGPCPGADLGGQTLTPGTYTCALNVGITTGKNLTLNGAGVYVFQITGNFTQAAATQVILAGGALPQNVFWQVSGSVDIGTTALMQGVILGQTLINMQAGSTEHGRLLAQTAVTLNSATVTVP